MVFRVFEERREKWKGVISELEKKIIEKGGYMKEELRDPVFMNYLVYGNFLEGLRRKFFLDRDFSYDHQYNHNLEGDIKRLNWFDEKRKDKNYKFKIDIHKDADRSSWLVGYLLNKDYEKENEIHESIFEIYNKKCHRADLYYESLKRKLENSNEWKIYKFVIEENSKVSCKTCYGSGSIIEQGFDIYSYPFITSECEVCKGSGKSGYVFRANPEQEKIFQLVENKMEQNYRERDKLMPEYPKVFGPERIHELHIHWLK